MTTNAMPFGDDPARIEEWALDIMGEPDAPAAGIAEAVRKLRGLGAAERADAVADLAQDLLLRRDDEAGLLLILRARFEGDRARDPASAQACLKTLQAMFDHRRDSLADAALKNAGFDGRIPTPEALRRFSVLRALKPGLLCLEKTWGCGVVTEVDAFYQRITVDFEVKHGHQFSMAYAAEALEPLAEDHIMAVRRRDPNRLARMVAEAPADVVRMALRSFGPMTAAQLQERLSPKVVEAADWKRFWAAARKDLKGDARIEIPVQRSAPIRLLDREADYGPAWFEELGRECDMDRILEMIDRLIRARSGKPLDAAESAIARDRLEFVARGAGLRKPGLLVAALLNMRALGLADNPSITAWIDSALVPDRIGLFLKDLPGRLEGAFLDLAAELAAERAAAVFLEVLSDLDMSVLPSVLDWLGAHGHEADAAARLKTAIMAGNDAVLVWAAKNQARAAAMGVAGPEMLLGDALTLMEDRLVSGRRLRAQNRLRAMFTDPAWLKQILAAVDDMHRREALRRLRHANGITPADWEQIRGLATEWHPELDLAAAPQPAAMPADIGRFTSARSYAARQDQLRKLVEEDIPRNSREIGAARAFGDLRENFEYKAAKDMQAVLMARQSELEAMLRQVKPTDFKGFQHKVAGIGTCVTLRHPDGRQVRYSIMGEWDSDEARGVISSQSPLAKALAGRRPGESAVIPSEAGVETWEVADVGPLPEDLLLWAAGDNG